MAQQLRPFRDNTRQNFQKAGVIPFAASGGVPLLLPKVGYLNRVLLNFRGTVTLSGAGSLTDLSPWNLLTRIGVNFNVAAAKVVDLTGYGAFLVTSKIEQGFRSDLAGAGQSTPHASVFAAPVASGANTWNFWVILPCAANDTENFEAGLINLQAPEVQVTVEPTFGAITDVAALATAITGNLHVYYEYFEVPDPRTVQQPYPLLHRIVEDSIPITGTGDNTYTVPRQGNLLGLINTLRLNGARSESYDQVQIVFNKTTYPYRMEQGLNRVRNRMINGFDWPTGVFDIDFFHAMGGMSAGDGRDKIDTEEMSTVEEIVTVSSGATLGSNNNFLSCIRRFTQVFTS